MYSCNGCGKFSDTRYCADCQKPQRPNFRQRGYGKVYEQNRKIRLVLDPFCSCQGCTSCRGTDGCLRQANTVDHIKRKRDGGSDYHTNLRSMCSQCHSRHTAIESPGGWNNR